jgi:hypothetical protein
MRKNGRAGIPDFSRKKDPAQQPTAEDDAKSPQQRKPARAPVQPKPQATSSKSGRRGQ